MRCKNIQAILIEARREDYPSEVRKHLEQCPNCRAEAAGLARLTEGMNLLARETAPEPSIGFRARVLRRLDPEWVSPADFLEHAGRQVVYATLLVVFFLLLAMTLPSSGPLRHKPRFETYSPQQETVTEGSYSVSLDVTPPAPVLVDFQNSSPGNN
jgi:hypothetical protein